MDDSEAGDRARSGHESDGTPLNSVNSTTVQWYQKVLLSAPKLEQVAPFVMNPLTLMLSREALFLTCLFPSQVI